MSELARIDGKRLHLGRSREETRMPERRPVKGGYVGSRFSEVWDAVASDPYASLPIARITSADVLRLLRERIYQSAQRTLRERADLLEPFDKLVHPVGICLAGRWRITEPTEYTGLFKTGRHALLIARASDALGEFREGKLRTLGLAGKLFPTNDPSHGERLPTANFFMLENLAGSHTRHFVDAVLSTDLLPIRPHVETASKLPLGAVLGPLFMLADRALRPTQAMIRPLDAIAALGEPEGLPVRSPVVMRFRGVAGNRRIETPDLREELRIAHHPLGIRFAIEVADYRSYGVPHGFRTIGEVHFVEAVASFSGDHRLHFHHPRGGA